MSVTHRPDIEAFAKDDPDNPKYREAYVWPHIDQEDLLKPKLLLIFLNARGRHPPYAFIAADRDSFRFGQITGNIMPPFLNEHVMMFTGRTTPETYGELINWYDDESAFDWLHTQAGMHPGDGLVSLEIQERVYGFLVECCMQLLCEHTHESIMSSEIPVQPEPPALSTSEAGLNMLAVMVAEAPYRLPASLNLRRLQGFVAAKRSAAEDHIWSMREDPGYFAEVLLDRREHRTELLPDDRGQIHPSARPHMAKQFWNKIINSVVSDAYLALGVWDAIQTQLTNLQTLLDKYGSNLKPEENLPKDLEWAFCRFAWLMGLLFRVPLINLQMSVPASPHLRQYFVQRQPQYAADNIRACTRNSMMDDKRRMRLSWIFSTMWDERMRFLAGLTTLMDELERLIQNEKYIKDLLSPWVMNLISDLSIMAECQREISLFQPWAATFENILAEKEDEIRADYIKNVDRWTAFDKPMEEAALSDVGDPSDGRFYYPVDKRRTKENTIAMQRAEANLDEFWKKVDRIFINKEGISQHAAIRHLLSENRILHRTPNWVDPTEVAKPAVQDPLADLCVPLSQLYFDLEERTQRTIRGDEKAPAARIKVKTRGTAITAPDSVADLPSAYGPDVQPTFTVDKRAHKVFSTLFYSPSRTSQPGEVAWMDFLHAMGSTGFMVEKLYGSVWQFTPRTLDVERSIQFHEPHPSGKIPFRVARRHGRRLNRAYGWHAGMFHLDG